MILIHLNGNLCCHWMQIYRSVSQISPNSANLIKIDLKFKIQSPIEETFGSRIMPTVHIGIRVFYFIFGFCLVIETEIKFNKINHFILFFNIFVSINSCFRRNELITLPKSYCHQCSNHSTTKLTSKLPYISTRRNLRIRWIFDERRFSK